MNLRLRVTQGLSGRWEVTVLAKDTEGGWHPLDTFDEYHRLTPPGHFTRFTSKRLHKALDRAGEAVGAYVASKAYVQVAEKLNGARTVEVTVAA